MNIVCGLVLIATILFVFWYSSGPPKITFDQEPGPVPVPYSWISPQWKRENELLRRKDLDFVQTRKGVNFSMFKSFFNRLKGHEFRKRYYYYDYSAWRGDGERDYFFKFWGITSYNGDGKALPIAWIKKAMQDVHGFKRFHLHFCCEIDEDQDRDLTEMMKQEAGEHFQMKVFGQKTFKDLEPT